MKKTILCVMAPQGRGKTSSVRRVDEILQSYGAKLVKELFEEGNDFCREHSFRSHSIGILSLGDPNSAQPEWLKKLADDNCDIIVCASRFKGNTCDVVSNITKKYGYERFWISPLYEYDSVHPLAIEMHELNAKFIIKAILFAYNSN